MTDFGKNVKIALICRGKTQNWLVEQLREKTGLKCERSYICNVINGKEKSEKVTNAIRQILNI